MYKLVPITDPGAKFSKNLSKVEEWTINYNRSLCFSIEKVSHDDTTKLQS